ncbi:MAG: SMP-30/gluconolactonase/LRE family protein, partial [Verrucomicrobiota bacterium]
MTLSAEAITKTPAKWGEGPVWWDNRLFYVDIEGHRLCAVDPSSGEEWDWAVGERIGCAVPRVGGGFIYAGDTGFHTLDLASGEKAAVT